MGIESEWGQWWDTHEKPLAIPPMMTKGPSQTCTEIILVRACVFFHMRWCIKPSIN